MTTTGTDITLVLSGGSSNININNSLGGDPSATPIIDDVFNNLFTDITSDQSVSGYEDYRCIYVFNDGNTTIYNMSLWLDNITDAGSSMTIGVISATEIQRITISGASVNGGSFTLNYKDKPLVSNYNTDLGIWATSLKNLILALNDDNGNNFFNDVNIVAQTIGTTIIFDIFFNGIDSQRNFDKFVLTSNDITPSTSIIIATTQEGSPINTLASQINVATTPPGGVGFYLATQNSPIVLPYLASGEGFPLWIKRTTLAGTVAQERDAFTLKIQAESLRPIS